jgi:glycosyltransferase involved in cell wall biosynthesis
MAMGIPVICNDGVGDTTEIVSQFHSGYVLPDLSTEAMESAVENIPGLMQLNKQKLADGACDFFSLEKGVETLDHIYRKVGLKKNANHR